MQAERRVAARLLTGGMLTGSPPSMIEKPLGVALIICDQVIVDKTTNKRTLVGIFNQIQARSFPCRQNYLAVFAQLTNGSGVLPVVLRCARQGIDEPLVEIEHSIDFPNPMATIEIEFLIEGLIFKQAGAHVFELVVDGEHVIESRFNVKTKTEEKPEQ